MTEFFKDGFVVVRGVLGLEECDRIISELESMRAVKGANFRQPHLVVPSCVEMVRKEFGNLLEGAVLMRSLFFDKTEESNWSVPWHQDVTICVRERREAPGFGPWSMKDGAPHVHAPAEILDQIVTVRIHLDDCGEENGPLRVLPGSHRCGRLSDVEIEHWRTTQAERVCVAPKGGALVMRPLLLHASSRAVAPSHRRVLHLEFCKGKLPFGLEWRGDSSPDSA